MISQRLTVRGLVQGIGFRPFVAELAEELNITGWVRNSGGIVTALAQGEESLLKEFRERLISDLPTGGIISEIVVNAAEESDLMQCVPGQFVIIASDGDATGTLPFIPADIATCDRCAAELADPDNRRYGHPFISCTVCGPRYSIINHLPYDRVTITMDDFDMCPDCQEEYVAKGNIRRHAQTIACPHCGPRLTGASIAEAADVIRAGGIVAVKDIGGYHLACDPCNEAAVASLREFKHREAKAFAVMFVSVDQVRQYAQVNTREQELLQSPARPIVLVRRKDGLSPNTIKMANNVCVTSPDIGAMLPCNPIQILLAQECGPLIMTSANASGDVLEIEDEAMKRLMDSCPARHAIISHNRRILRPLDDSVVKVVAGRTQFIRRARGYVPTPIPTDIRGQIFAAGGDLKSTFCHVKNGYAYVSQHLGDLESMSCQEFYRAEQQAMRTIFGFEPEVTVADMHPGYYSAKIAPEEAKRIQHHRAHVAAVIAEQGLKGPVLGFAYDGTGYGDDGSIWGSEAFTWDGGADKQLIRVAHLRPARLIGGDEGARNCNTILAGFLHEYGIEYADTEKINPMIGRAIDAGINVVTSTSMGRLFDAVSALLGICCYNSYEGQAPIELENAAWQAGEEQAAAYSLRISPEGDCRDLFMGLITGQAEGASPAALARAFINAVSDYIIAQTVQQDIHSVVLSGGTFLNRMLTERTIALLENGGYTVHMASLLPPGDGGLCLGQAWMADTQSGNA